MWRDLGDFGLVLCLDLASSRYAFLSVTNSDFVLVVFMNILLFVAHSLIASRSLFKHWVSDWISEKCALAVIVVSSAKISTDELDRCSGRSFANSRNNTGSSTETCGTPCFMIRGSDFWPSVVDLWKILVRAPSQNKFPQERAYAGHCHATIGLI